MHVYSLPHYQCIYLPVMYHNIPKCCYVWYHKKIYPWVVMYVESFLVNVLNLNLNFYQTIRVYVISIPGKYGHLGTGSEWLVYYIYIDFFWCFNATFSNISAISWRPVLVVEEYPKRTTDHGQATGKLKNITYTKII